MENAVRLGGGVTAHIRAEIWFRARGYTCFLQWPDLMGKRRVPHFPHRERGPREIPWERCNYGSVGNLPAAHKGGKRAGIQHKSSSTRP